MDKLFVIAIGGTGMRCLEAFVHLCAIGMFDSQEIEILTLDTDQTNGNKGRVETLINLYNKVKSNDEAHIDGGNPNSNTFFSAKLNLYKFYTDYNAPERKNYKVLSQTDQENTDNQDLADLLLDHSVQYFSLDHGYRAQTHLGSILMYHGIIEAIRNCTGGKSAQTRELDLKKFVERLNLAAGQARVFVFGSVFGGTGASSIPIIPVALRDAVSILDNNRTLDLSKIKFGATLLTEYFSFNSPGQKQKSEELVIADSNNFTLNSQAALQFYQADPTVKKTYKKLYHVGWPLNDKLDVGRKDNGETTTGGNLQRNACHIVELMCASAAYDFFTLGEEELGNTEVSYCFRAPEFDNNSFNFGGKDFVGEKGDMLTNKLGAFLSFAHIVLSLHKAATQGELGTESFIVRLRKQNIMDYDTITKEQTRDIDAYLKMFAYDFNRQKDEIERGWIYQLSHSIGSGKFIFKSDAFKAVRSELERIDPGDIFTDDKHNWDKGGFLGSRYDTFIKKLVEDSCKPKENQKVTTTKEKFLAHIYNGITIAQKYNQ